VIFYTTETSRSKGISYFSEFLYLFQGENEIGSEASVKAGVQSQDRGVLSIFQGFGEEAILVHGFLQLRGYD